MPRLISQLLLALWLWVTQRNDQGPRWVDMTLLLSLAAAALVGYWVLFRWLIEFTAYALPRHLNHLH